MRVKAKPRDREMHDGVPVPIQILLDTIEEMVLSRFERGRIDGDARILFYFTKKKGHDLGNKVIIKSILKETKGRTKDYAISNESMEKDVPNHFAVRQNSQKYLDALLRIVHVMLFESAYLRK